MDPDSKDEIDCGSFFDQIEDFIEFPPDNECVDGNLGSSFDGKDFPSWDEALKDCDPLFSGTTTSDLATELSVPYEDIVQLEWLSTFVEDSFSGGGLTLGKENVVAATKDSSQNQFQTLSPVSVVESSSSSSCSSGGKTVSLPPCHRARSKRPRPPVFNPRPPIQLVSRSSSSVENPPASAYYGYSTETDSFAESPMKKFQKRAGDEQKRKRVKILSPANPRAARKGLTEAMQHELPAQEVQKCLHCEITKTPQWRAGPMGPKTLCNACGVRYKSGRLFPEYRPAASPTFVPSLHSNSHKKVLEMRVKVEPTSGTEEAAEPATSDGL